MSLEQEIKLAVLQTEPLDIEALPLIANAMVAAPVSMHLLNTYFDTSDMALMKNKLGLRLRQIDQRYLQTVKANGQVVNGLHQRPEWEHELAGPAFNDVLLAETPLADIMEDKSVWSTLSPVFTTDFQRLEVQLEIDGTLIELAYDQGQVSAADRTTIIHEIELELKQGQLKIMQDLADSLKALLPLDYSDTSKAKMGYELSQAIDI